MKRIIIVSFLLLFLSVSALGYDVTYVGDATYPLDPSTGSLAAIYDDDGAGCAANISRWKSVRVQATASGTVTHYLVKVGGSMTGANMGYGVWQGYSNAATQPGSLLISGVQTGVNLSSGAGWYALPFTADATLSVTAGQYFYLGFYESGEQNNFCRDDDETFPPKWVDSDDEKTYDHPELVTLTTSEDSASWMMGLLITELGYPNTITTSGTWTHGSTNAVITGAEFGTKSPAAPLLWQNFESKEIGTNPSTADGTGSGGQYGWTSSGGMTDWNVYGGATLADTVEPPHSNSTKYLAGEHWPGLNTNMEIGYAHDSEQNAWFVMAYIRTSPSWAEPPAAGYCASYGGTDDLNYKEWWFQPSCEVSADYGNYIDASQEQPAPGPFNSSAQAEYSNSALASPCGHQINGVSWGTNPSLGWGHKYTVMRINPGRLQMRNYSAYGTGISTLTDESCEGELFPSLAEDKDSVCAIIFGSYTRYCLGETVQLFPDMFRYLDDVYIDNTLSRVMLCNDETYEDATICEPQIPSAWSGTSITVTVNQGALPDGTAYLFVFDSDNAVNGTGYPVTLGAGSSFSAHGMTIGGGGHSVAVGGGSLTLTVAQ